MQKSYRPSEIKRLRETSQLSQAQVAQKLGLSVRQWCRIERGEAGQKPRRGHMELLELLAQFAHLQESQGRTKVKEKKEK